MVPDDQEIKPYKKEIMSIPNAPILPQINHETSSLFWINNDRPIPNPSLNNPPNPPHIEGPTTGKTRTIYLFNITLTDPDEDPLVILEVDFGDGSEIFQECGCNGPWPSGKVIKVEHQWNKQGTFLLKARVQEGSGLWSDWGTLELSFAKSHSTPFWGILDYVLQIFTSLFYRY